MVVFEKCDAKKLAPGLKCKSEAEIAQWMAFKYMVVLENEAKFIQFKFGQDRVTRNSGTRWFPLSYD